MMAVEIGRLAAEKSAGSAALRTQWELALSRLLSTGMDEAGAGKLLGAATTPGQLSRVASSIGGNGAEALAAILADCDESPHDLQDWLAGMDVLLSWLEAHGRKAGAQRVSGYVSCSSSGAPDAKLPDTVRRMLEIYGFDESAG